MTILPFITPRGLERQIKRYGSSIQDPEAVWGEEVTEEEE